MPLHAAAKALGYKIGGPQDAPFAIPLHRHTLWLGRGSDNPSDYHSFPHRHSAPLTARLGRLFRTL